MVWTRGSEGLLTLTFGLSLGSGGFYFTHMGPSICFVFFFKKISSQVIAFVFMEHSTSHKDRFNRGHKGLEVTEASQCGSWEKNLCEGTVSKPRSRPAELGWMLGLRMEVTSMQLGSQGRVWVSSGWRWGLGGRQHGDGNPARQELWPRECWRPRCSGLLYANRQGLCGRKRKSGRAGTALRKAEQG